MCIGQPVVQRCKTDLCAIAHEEKHKREAQYRRLKLSFDTIKVRPQQRRNPRASQDLLRREVQQDRSK